MMLLRVTELTKTFPAVSDAPAKDVLASLSLQIDAGERVGLIGPSGCGKTTLLSIIAGLEKPDTGIIERCDAMRIGLMFQEPRLLPWRNVSDNISVVLGPDHDPCHVNSMLKSVGLADAREVYASHLSLGMARRAALARSFIIKPQLLLMDEPFVSLDAANALRLRRLLLDLLAQQGASLLLVTHDIREAIMLCDRLVFLTQAPAKLLFEFEVDLTYNQRFDEAIIERRRTQLIDEYGVDTSSLIATTNTG